MSGAAASAKQIFLDALDRPIAERDAFVRRACGDDTVLLTAVADLLAADAGAGRFLAGESVVISKLTAPGGEREQAGRLLSGTVVGGVYEIVGEVGEGGFGIVYRALQRSPLERTVALKVIKPGMDTRRVIARFQAEREALARMDHPSIARVLDAGETGDGRPFFVMEFVDGQRIDEVCRGRELSLRARLRLVQGVCRAVQHAHQKGVLHRDLKPSNVLVTLADGGLMPKVIDFGMAKALEPGSAEGSLLTMTGELVGTPAYMSPEQAACSTDIDTRSDVYAIGVLLYELLTGAPPAIAVGETPGYAEMLRRVQEDEPQRPSARVAQTRRDGTALVTSFGPRELRAELDWIVAKCLAKDRGQRYVTASAVADEIQRFLDGLPVSVGPPSTSYVLRKFARRHRVALGVASAFLVLLVAGTIAIAAAWLRARGAEREARQAQHDAERELAKYEEIAAFTTEMLQGIDPAVARGADTSVLRDMLERARERLRTSPPEVEVVAGSLRNTIGVAYLQIGDYQTALEEFDAALEITRGMQGEEHPETFGMHHHRLVALYHLGGYVELESEAREVAERATVALGSDHEATLDLVGLLASTLGELGRWEAARTVFADLLERQQRKYGPEHDFVLTTKNNFARVLHKAKEVDRGIALYEEVLAAQRARHGDDHPKTLATMNNLASAYDTNGDTPRAVALQREALEIKRRILGPGHPSTIISEVNLATQLRESERLVEAEAAYRRGYDLAREHLGPDHHLTTLACLNLGSFCRQHGDAAEAVQHYRLALPGVRAQLGEAHPKVLLSRGTFAAALLDVGEREAALAEIDEVVGLGTEALAGDWRLGQLLRTRGRARQRLGDLEAAERDLLEAWRLVTELEGASQEVRRQSAERLADLYDAWERPQPAAEWRQRAADSKADR
ncbi:MAG: tetratricopeptide repeat protein [Planctomycetota bacterium]